MQTIAQTLDPVPYRVSSTSIDEESILARAMQILAGRVRTGPIMDSPSVVKDYLRVHFAAASAEGREVFAVLFLDAQHHVIDVEDLFRGTLTQTSVYPREVVKRALAHNAAAVVLAHNHPSGIAEPSRADEHLTATLRSALALVDVRVLDHLVVGNPATVSFAERGLL
jgi:DNA repair protein RadC